MTSIIGSALSLIVMFVGKALFAQLAGSVRFWWYSLTDPALKAAVEAEYQRINNQAQNQINQRPPK